MNTSSPPKRSSRPGRSSRRRKRKAQSILNAATSLVETAASPFPVAVPSDRGITLEGVKFRRIEFRRRVLNLPDDANVNVDEYESLDPSDEQQLTSQLGFVPGNVVSVAARLPTEFCVSTETTPTNNRLSQAPSVVKLYPMVIRDAFHGGKSDGRKFKGRRRGGMRTDEVKSDANKCKLNSEQSTTERVYHDQEKDTTSIDTNKNDAIASPQCTKQPSNGRCWYIESSNDNQDNLTAKRQIIEPFPTLYWLTSPLLRSYISQIELSKTHGVQKMEQKLKSSTQYLEQMKRAHMSYGKSRWELLTDDDREHVLKRDWGEALGVGRGVAGIRPKKSNGKTNVDESETWDGIKCLHAHAAHYLAQVEEWRGTRRREQSNNCNEKENEMNKLATLIQTCDREDLNLVGKWTMEAVLEFIQHQT